MAVPASPEIDVPAISASNDHAETAPEATMLDRRPFDWNDLAFARLTNIFLLLGIVVRIVRYSGRFPLWGDESFLVLNLIQRGYAELRRPLELTQVAPLSYLWLERAMIEMFGVSEYSLRAVAIVASICGLVLFRYVAALVLRGGALAFAVGILAVSFYPIRHAAEVKPYASDLLAAMLVLLPALAWRTRPERTARIWILTLCTIVAQLMSFTAVFVAGGVSIALLPEVWRRRNKGLLSGYIIYNLAIVATFGLVVGVLAAADGSVGEDMRKFWAEGFPPSWREPVECLKWFASVHTGEALAYPVGGQNSASTLQLLLSLVGAVSLWRAGGAEPTNVRACVGRTFVVATAGTLGLALIAGIMHRYPYGIAEKLQQYWAPFVCILMGQGITVAIGSIRGFGHRRRTAIGVIAVLVALGVGQVIYTYVRPYKFRQDYLHRSFAEWFWQEPNDAGPLVTLEDLGTKLHLDYCSLTLFTLRAIYDDRHDYTSTDPRAADLRLEAIPAGARLRVVSMKPVNHPWFPGALENWLQAMEKHYRLTDEIRYPFTLGMDNFSPYAYHVWTFEPLTPQSHPRAVRAELLKDVR